MNDGPHEPGDFQRDDAPLWRLLGKSSPPPVSPYFARRVLRETMRLEEEGGWLRRWAAGWRLPHPAWSGAVAAVVICAVSVGVAGHHKAPRRASARTDVHEDITPRDVEVIANLDNLMAYEENRIWTDESSTD